jgi:hypothetical protein
MGRTINQNTIIFVKLTCILFAVVIILKLCLQQAGFKDFEQLDQESHFNSIRNHPEFVQLRNQIQQEVLSKGIDFK